MSYLQQHKLVVMCVAWGADRKDAVLHNMYFEVKSLHIIPMLHIEYFINILFINILFMFRNICSILSELFVCRTHITRSYSGTATKRTITQHLCHFT